MKSIRILAAAVCSFAMFVLAVAGPNAIAQDFPSKPIRLVVPAVPGGSSDSITRMLAKVMQDQTGIDLVHVPYKGASPALLALITQDVDITVTSPASLKGFIDSRQLQAIAFTGSKRSAILPNVPTMIEQGFPDFVLSAWWGIFLPAGVPAPVSEKLTAMILSAVRSPEFQKHAEGLSLDVAPVMGKSFSQSIGEQNARWKQLIDKSQIKLD